MQIKTTMGYHFTAGRMAIRKSTINAGKGVDLNPASIVYELGDSGQIAESFLVSIS